MTLRRLTPLLLATAALSGCFYHPAHAATPYPMGFKSNPHHARGLTQIVHAPGFAAAPLPTAATVREYFYDTNQDTGSTCVGFSGIEEMDAVFKKNTGAFVHPSPLDLYQQCTMHDGTWPKDGGTYTSTALLIATRSAICPESKWPYVMSNYGTPPPACAVNARSFYAAKAYDVPNDDHGYAIKNCIATLRIPVMTGGAWPANWFEVKKDKRTGKTYLPHPKGWTGGGHEIVLVSFDDKLWIDINGNGKVDAGETGWVEFHNHWANANRTPWGDGGFCWIPQKDAFNSGQFEDSGAMELTAKKAKK